MLSEKYSGGIYSSLLPVELIRPYPKACDRDMWDSVGDRIRSLVHKRVNRYSDCRLEPLKGTDITDACTSGDMRRLRELFTSATNLLSAFALVECVDGNDEYTERILDAAWAVLDMAVWYLPKGNGEPGECYDIREPLIDLHSSYIGFVLSYIYYLFREKFDEYDPNINKRFRFELERRMMKPFIGSIGANDAAALFTGNVVFPFLVFDVDYETRHEAVRKSMEQTDARIDVNNPADLEGILKYIDIMHMATDGVIDAYSEDELCKMAFSALESRPIDTGLDYGLLKYAYHTKNRTFSERLFGILNGSSFIDRLAGDIPLDNSLFYIFNHNRISEEFHYRLSGKGTVNAEG